MRFLIVGSEPSTPTEGTLYTKACEQLGQALAEKGHEISLSTDATGTADLHVFEGASRSQVRARIEICYHDNEAIPFGSRRAELQKSVDITWLKVPGTWATGRVPQIQKADAVVVMSGGDKSAQVGHLARHLDVPCIPLPTFGGASGEMWPSFEAGCKERQIPADAFRGKVEPWDDTQSAAAILEFADRLATARRARNSPIVLYLVLLGVVAAAVGVWAALFFRPPEDYALLGMIAAGSCIGVGLRAFTEYLGHSQKVETWLDLAVRIAAGALIAFGMFLLTLVGALAIQGDLTFLEEIDQGMNFERIGVTVTLFGLAGGLLTEQTFHFIAERVGKLFEEGA